MSKKGTKVTERNMMAMAGKITNFLKKPTVVEDGRPPIAVDAVCQESFVRRRIIEKSKHDSLSAEDKVFMHNNLLQIVDNGVHGVLPISNGSHIRITGDRMTVTLNDTTIWYYDYHYARIKRMSLMGRNSVYVFRHIPEDEGYEDERIRNILRNVYSNASDEEPYVESDMVPCEDLPMFRSYCCEIMHAMTGIIEGVDVSQGEVTEEITIGEDDTPNGFPITVVINVDANRIEPKYGEDSMSFHYGNETFDSTTELVLTIMDEFYNE